jgi:hypothetical protein
MHWNHISARMAREVTMTSDHIRAATTYVMWPEEHLWYVSVLQRVAYTFKIFFSQNPTDRIWVDRKALLVLVEIIKIAGHKSGLEQPD